MSLVPASAITSGRPTTVTPPDGWTRWHAVPPRPECVAEARKYAITLVRQSAAPSQHVDDVARVGTELVTNAVLATIAAPAPPQGTLTAVSLGVRAPAGYTLLKVRDAVPAWPEPREPYTDERGELHGLGLGIVDALSVAWWTVMREHDKTVHAVVPWPGVLLTAAVLKALRR